MTFAGQSQPGRLCPPIRRCTDIQQVAREFEDEGIRFCAAGDSDRAGISQSVAPESDPEAETDCYNAADNRSRSISIHQEPDPEPDPEAENLSSNSVPRVSISHALSAR